MADDVTPFKASENPKRREIRAEGTSYEAPDIGDYTVPSLSWVVAMAHRDYIVHRGIYSRCRRRFLPTRRFLIAGLVAMTCLALDPLPFPLLFPALSKNPRKQHERCVAWGCARSLQRSAVNPREWLKTTDEDFLLKNLVQFRHCCFLISSRIDTVARTNVSRKVTSVARYDRGTIE